RSRSRRVFDSRRNGRELKKFGRRRLRFGASGPGGARRQNTGQNSRQRQETGSNRHSWRKRNEFVSCVLPVGQRGMVERVHERENLNIGQISYTRSRRINASQKSS